MNCNDEATSLERTTAAHASGSAGGGAAEDGDTKSLYPFIHLDHTWALNVEPPQGATACLKPWHQRMSEDTYTESGVDDQFILNIPFTQPVRIKSILINPGRGDFAPRRIRAYVNRIHGVDFEEVEASSAATAPDLPAAQRAALGGIGSGKPQADFALLDGEPGVSEYPVSAARFASVNSISVVLSDANARERSQVFYLGFRGSAQELTREPGDKLTSAAANAADAPVGGVKERAAGAQSTAR